jgi:RimJ/RimL family protein N-acetyltransferase
MTHADIAGLGRASIRRVVADEPRPASPSEWEDWGEMATEPTGAQSEHWLVELTTLDGSVVPVGELSAHPVWYGPSTGSRALNIGISLVPEFRGRGIGSAAQRLLAEELHALGIRRVEASTDVANLAEQRALARAGFTYEGTLRQAQQRRDGVHDLQSWSHLAPVEQS